MKRSFVLGILFVTLICAGLSLYTHFSQKIYSAEDFGIETFVSGCDFDGDGIDDAADIVEGARKDALNMPRYDGSYHAGGYPPDDIGVCTDLVWRAFKNAGYLLKDMVDADIKERPEAYTRIERPDPNIDFRRVYNLRVFFEKYAESLTLDPDDIAQWQPGDIVIYENDKHIGIISDKRNMKGQPYVIHNSGQEKREENSLTRGNITGHYRFMGRAFLDTQS